MTRARRPAAQRGSATVWVVSCMALVLVIATFVVIRAAAVVARHRAESAADLAALAGAGRIGVDDSVCAAARLTAAANRARLGGCRVSLAADGRSGVVLVHVVLEISLPVVGDRTVSATARAGRLPAVAPRALLKPRKAPRARVPAARVPPAPGPAR